MQSTLKEKQTAKETGILTESSDEQDGTILLRIARIALGTSVRWKREIKNKDNHEMQTGSASSDSNEKAQYCSRLLACTRCGTEQETKDKQMRFKEGFRAINCKKCGKQERVHSNMCRCNVIWHHCPIHRIDPPQHNLWKIKKKLDNGKKDLGNKMGIKSSTRAAPLIEEASPQPANKSALMRPNLHIQGRMLEMQMREKEAKRKSMDADSVSKKKRCDREERIAGVQLKTYWELYPLPTCERQAEHTPIPD